MESYLNVGGSNAGLRVSHGDVSLVGGIGRHRIRVNDTVSAANERADQLVFTFTGDLVIPSLGIASGYVGSIVSTTPQRITRDGSFPITLDIEVTDDQIRRIQDRRSVSPDGGFDLLLNLRFETIDPQNVISHAHDGPNLRSLLRQRDDCSPPTLDLLRLLDRFQPVLAPGWWVYREHSTLPLGIDRECA